MGRRGELGLLFYSKILPHLYFLLVRCVAYTNSITTSLSVCRMLTADSVKLHGQLLSARANQCDAFGITVRQSVI